MPPKPEQPPVPPSVALTTAIDEVMDLTVRSHEATLRANESTCGADVDEATTIYRELGAAKERLCALATASPSEELRRAVDAVRSEMLDVRMCAVRERVAAAHSWTVNLSVARYMAEQVIRQLTAALSRQPAAGGA
jgi:hypothetical protein